MTRPEHHDYLVLGAGPGGLQIACFLRRAGRDCVVLDASDAPGAFKMLSITRGGRRSPPRAPR